MFSIVDLFLEQFEEVKLLMESVQRGLTRPPSTKNLQQDRTTSSKQKKTKDTLKHQNNVFMLSLTLTDEDCVTWLKALESEHE